MSSSEFRHARFCDVASFAGATFSDQVRFVDATFSRGVTFFRATFSGLANFYDTTFSSEASFLGTTFSGVAKFDRAIFSDLVRFHEVAFSDEASFVGTKFQAVSSFVNAEFKGESNFETAKFLIKPPRFFGTKLHQGTVWRGVDWPTPKKADEAGTFIDAYACLKLEMDRLKKHEDELDFFVLELQSRRIEQGLVRGLPIAIFGFLSEYGRSYIQPLVALFYLALTGTLAFLSSDSLSPWQSFGLSFANTFNVFGFRKDFFDAATIENLPALLKILAAIQTILGTILLFFGLGVRNKFRMK